MAIRRAHGIDISHYQEQLITPPKNAADIDFVILKASQATWQDSAFERLYESAKEFPIRGAYHYFITQRYRSSKLLSGVTGPNKPKKNEEKEGKGKQQPKKSGGSKRTVLYGGKYIEVEPARIQLFDADGPSWEDQANFFLSQVAGKNIQFYALDVEHGLDPDKFIGFDKNLFTLADVRNIKSWIEYIRKKTGKPVLLYTNVDVYKNYLLKYGGKILADLDLWIAGYLDMPKQNEKDPLLEYKVPANKWNFWQYSANGNRKGPAYGVKSADIDLNVFNGTFEDLRAWLKLDGAAPGKPVTKDAKLPTKEELILKNQEKLQQEMSAQLTVIQKAGLTPIVQIHLNMDEFDLETVNFLKGKLQAFGITPEVHLNMPLRVSSATGSHANTPRDGGKEPEPVIVPGKSSEEEPGGTQPVAGKGIQEQLVGEAKPDESFSVQVIEEKAVVQYFKERDDKGKPFMIPLNPRIRMPKGTRFKVSATYKASDKDSGDGVVFGTGRKTFYFITECPFNKDAEGYFVKQSDVIRV